MAMDTAMDTKTGTATATEMVINPPSTATMVGIPMKIGSLQAGQ
jgi:hypothetical protein